MNKIIAAGTTFLIDATVAVIIGFFLLVAMNGYSEHAATWGLGSYLVASLSACCLAAFMAVNLSRIYLQRPTSTGAGIFLSISISTSIGIAITVVSSFIAIAVAEYARTHR